jgi:hypothetical protein
VLTNVERNVMKYELKYLHNEASKYDGILGEIMKIGRNDPCPCGSGKKYKKCCIDKKDDVNFSDPVNIPDSINNTIKQRFVKQCIHPSKEVCSENIIKAHSIQNNKILTKLAVNGHVISMKQDKLFFMSGEETGRKVASTFTGFCSYHDKTTFQDIEDYEFVGNPKQLFLFAYRAFALEYHRKLEQSKMFQFQFSKMPSIAQNEEQMNYYHAMLLGLNDNDKTKGFLDEGIIDGSYDILNHCIWEIPYEIEFATSTAFGLHYDLNGRKINDYFSKDRIRNIFINIFPTTRKSFCLFSWLKIDDDCYQEFGKQFEALDDNKKKKYLNNLIPLMTENIIISPRLWESWGESKQHDFEALFHLVLIMEEDSYRDLIEDTHFDLFENLKLGLE